MPAPSAASHHRRTPRTLEPGILIGPAIGAARIGMQPIVGYRQYLGAPILPGTVDATTQILPLARGRDGRVVRQAVPVIRYLTDSQLVSMLRLAKSRPALEWKPERGIALARNAHRTNTLTELTQALAGEYDFMECDVRLDSYGQPITAHDAGAREVISVDEWLAVGMASGKGLKLDFKEAGAVLPTLEMCKRHGVPASKLIINVTVYGEPEANITTQQLKRIRELYPDAVVNLSVNTQTITPDVLARLKQWSRAAGGPVMFPMRWDLVDEELIRQLKPFGKVAVWNNPQFAAPKNAMDETVRLRKMGVDGMIDISPARPIDAIAAPLFDALVAVVGWKPALEAVRAANSFFELFD
jgi:hypothetical protein